MAHIFAGDLSKIDGDALSAARMLPDDFWVFAEVNLGRNIDWLIVRESSLDQPCSTVITTELKRFSNPVTGHADGPWSFLIGEETTMPLPYKDNDINPYWQAVNGANAVGRWLWNNQRLIFSRMVADQPLDAFKVWPDLLLIGVPGSHHRLPLRPASGFGKWFFDPDEWARHVLEWRPRRGLCFTAHDLAALAGVIGVSELPAAWTPAVHHVKMDPTAHAEPHELLINSKRIFTQRLETLQQRVEALEQALACLTHTSVLLVPGSTILAAERPS